MSDAASRHRADIVLLAIVGGLASAISFFMLPVVPATWAAALGWAMAAISISDARRFIVPDSLSLPAIPAGLLASGFLGDGSAEMLTAFDHLVGMLVGAVLFMGVRSGYRQLRGREGLGLGDVKLAAVAGAWTALDGLLHVVMVAGVTALIFVGGVAVAGFFGRHAGATLTYETAIPFGAFLAPAIWLVHIQQSAAIGVPF